MLAKSTDVACKCEVYRSVMRCRAHVILVELNSPRYMLTAAAWHGPHDHLAEQVRLVFLHFHVRSINTAQTAEALQMMVSAVTADQR